MDDLHNTLVCLFESFDREAVKREGGFLAFGGFEPLESLEREQGIAISALLQGGLVALSVSCCGDADIAYESEEAIFDAQAAAAAVRAAIESFEQA